VGNHELYNFSRDELNERLNNNPTDKSKAYYSVSIYPGWRLVLLDGYEISVIQPETKVEAYAILSKHNTNDLSRTDVDWTAGLHGLDRRFMPYNGKISKTQQTWLHEELATATSAKEKVLISCHIPVCPGSSTPDTLLWNYDEVLAILHSYPCVKGFFAGHDHVGGFAVDAKNIHHKTFQAALEPPVGQMAYAIVSVYDDVIEINGEGTVTSEKWPH